MAKMTPKTLDMSAVGGSTSIRVLDWTDAAHSLAGLKNDEYNWALYCFVGHKNKERNIIRTLTMTVTLLIKIRKWKIKPETVDGLVRVALLEFTQPVCRTCSGSGWTTDKTEPTECKPCKGQGRKSISERERGRVIGIDRKSMSEKHKELTKEIMIIISTWEQRIFKNIREKMGEDE